MYLCKLVTFCTQQYKKANNKIIVRIFILVRSEFLSLAILPSQDEIVKVH